MFCLISFIFVVIAIVIHYESLTLLSKVLTAIKTQSRIRVVILVLWLFLTHMLEILMYGVAYILIDHYDLISCFHGDFHGDFMDYLYYSSIVYTAIGFGDMTPVGPVRFLTAMESLSGILLMSWSASFTFLKMQTFWEKD